MSDYNYRRSKIPSTLWFALILFGALFALYTNEVESKSLIRGPHDLPNAQRISH